tara:strand:+ start:27 stop:245 length:219 start_codon:yes stop_codon:yes gene_type:complete
MALEDLQSTFGPYNKKGVKGTGEIYDTLAFESAPRNTGVVGGNSKYATSGQNGIKPTGPDVFGNIPPERSGE